MMYRSTTRKTNVLDSLYHLSIYRLSIIYLSMYLYHLSLLLVCNLSIFLLLLVNKYIKTVNPWIVITLFFTKSQLNCKINEMIMNR